MLLLSSRFILAVGSGAKVYLGARLVNFVNTSLVAPDIVRGRETLGSDTVWVVAFVGLEVLEAVLSAESIISYDNETQAN